MKYSIAGFVCIIFKELDYYNLQILPYTYLFHINMFGIMQTKHYVCTA